MIGKSERIALVVVDMQNRFHDCTMGGSVTMNCVSLINRFHHDRLPVFLTQHQDPNPESVLYKWWNTPIEWGSQDWQLIPEIDAAVMAEDTLIQEKTTYDAFIGTPLQEKLEAAGTKSLVVCGCMTNLCCETTTRAAFCRGFNVWFPEDANGTLTQEMQTRSVENLRYGFATICKTADLLTNGAAT